MKKTAGLFIILIAIILGSYFAMGWITERTLKKTVDIVNQSNGLSVDIVQYDRGWFQSHAQANWRLHIPSRINKSANGQLTTSPAKDYQFSMPIIIHHGPIMFTQSTILFGLGAASTHFELPTEDLKAFQSEYTANSTMPQLNLNIFVNYLNQTHFQTTMPPFQLISKTTDKKLIWEGMTSQLNLSSHNQHIIGDFKINGLSLSQNHQDMMIGEINSDYDLHETNTGLFLGDAHIAFPAIQIKENGQDILKINGFNLQSKSDILGALFHSSLKVGVDQLVTSGEHYGPALLNVSLKNLDAHVLAEMNHEMTQLHPNTDFERQKLFLSLLPKLAMLVSKGAELNVSSLNVQLPEGNIQGNLEITLPHESAGNLFQVLQKITGQCHLTISAPVLKKLITRSLKQKLLNNSPTTTDQTAALDTQVATQADEKIATLVKNGLLNAQGDLYVLDLKLSNSHLVVNGKPFQSEMMQF